jgi:hypothetical protein
MQAERSQTENAAVVVRHMTGTLAASEFLPFTNPAESHLEVVSATNEILTMTLLRDQRLLWPDAGGSVYTDIGLNVSIGCPRI